MYARLSRFAGLEPGRIDGIVRDFEEEGLAGLQSQKGFAGITVAVNYTAGQSFVLSLWESEHDMRESEKTAADARERAIAAARPSRTPVVDHYEIVLQR